MANKKVSDTLSQQRKAREDFLALKKMQSGEISPEPKPSEIAVLPKTFKEKWQNYWFHFKWHTIGIAFTVIVLVVLIAQCASRTDYDMKVVYFTNTPVLDQKMEEIGTYLEGLSKDINGDGETHIQVVNCSTSNGAATTQYNQAMYTKLQSMIAADEEALLFITDKASQEYFKNSLSEGFFATEPISFGEDFYKATESKELGSLPEGLQISCRKIADTTIAKNKNIEVIHKEALNILDKIKNKD